MTNECRELKKLKEEKQNKINEIVQRTNETDENEGELLNNSNFYSYYPRSNKPFILTIFFPLYKFKTECLIDTGSDVNLISINLLRKFNIKTDNKTSFLLAANGSKIEVIGKL